MFRKETFCMKVGNLAPILAADARVLLPFLQPYNICVELNKVKKAKI